MFGYLSTSNISIKSIKKPSSALLSRRPPTWLLQALRSWAILSNGLQVYPVSLTSASRAQRHVFLGRPLSLFLSGFQVKPCRIMLSVVLRRVVPIHLWRMGQIFCSTGNRLLMMISSYQTPRILLGQLLTNVCILFVVVLHVSAPQRRTEIYGLIK